MALGGLPEATFNSTTVSTAYRFGDAGRPARSRAQAHASSPGISTRRHRKTRQMPPSKARQFPQHPDSMTLGGPPEATFKGTTVLPASRFDNTERPARSHVRRHGNSPASRLDDAERPARSHPQAHDCLLGISIRRHWEVCQNQPSKAPEFRRHLDSTSPRDPLESRPEGT